MGIIYYKEQNYSKAAEMFQKASEHETDEPAYHLLVALCYKIGGKEKAAAEYLGRILPLLSRESPFYHMARYYMDPSSDFFIVQQINSEKDRTLKARMLFYIGAQYKLQGKLGAARTYFLEAADMRTNGFIENSLAFWELRGLNKENDRVQ
jgi:tetratricopeptide (TPR) repeat protein